MVLVKKRPFFHVFLFFAIQARKMCFTIFQNKKNAFLAPQKTKLQKLKNRDFFQRGFPWFWSKNGHFSMSFFQAIQVRKMCFRIFYNTKTPSQPIKKRSSKSRKIEIFPKGLPMVLVKKWLFFHLFSLGNISQENKFCDILERKNAFLAHKNNKFKKSKN